MPLTCELALFTADFSDLMPFASKYRRVVKFKKAALRVICGAQQSTLDSVSSEPSKSMRIVRVGHCLIGDIQTHDIDAAGDQEAASSSSELGVCASAGIDDRTRNIG